MDLGCEPLHCPAMPKRTLESEKDLSPERRNLVRAARKAGIGLAVLSRDHLKRNHAYLGQYVWSGTPRRLEEDDRKKLAVLLEIDESHLKSGAKLLGEREPVDKSQSSLVETLSGSVQFLPGTNDLRDQPRDLPILGSVRAGGLGFFLDQGELQGMARRPPILMGIKNAFALYVRDESMMPVLKPGHIIWVHPSRPEVPGENVIIEQTDGQAFVKEYRRKTEKHVICWQYNPAGEVKYDRAKVKSLMLVVGSCIEE